METVGLKAGFLLARMKVVQAANFRQSRTGADTRTGWLLNSVLNVGDLDPALSDATIPLRLQLTRTTGLADARLQMLFNMSRLALSLRQLRH